MKKIPFNLNNDILVKLNNKGEKILNDYIVKDHHYDGFEVNDEGYTKFQAWEFMNIFGEAMVQNGLPTPFDMNIIFIGVEDETA